MAVNTPTTLGSLEFAQIKTSLTEFLRNQSIFSGYNFEGSAIQTIIDLMAYNTFYYAYYANMISAEAFLDSAQREASLISLCKPLGYIVPAATASKAKITVNGIPNPASLNNKISENTPFFATDETGIQYIFYPLRDVNIPDNGNVPEFDVYEATSYVDDLDVLPTFDFDNQKISFASDSFDITSIRVKTVEDGQTYIWTPVSNIGYVAQASERIFFIERTSNGFSIQFGSPNSLGRSVDSDTTTQLLVRYITTSGSAANGLSNFSSSSFGGNTIITTVSQSAGGRNAPDPDLVRFLAPKWFASQERAVTINDYKALLLEAGFFEDQTEFNVFGGQDIVPPMYGRVFVTSNLNLGDSKISEMIDFLKERSVVTVLPEYVLSNSLNIFTDFSFSVVNTGTLASTLQQVRTLFSQNFAKTNEYNVVFSATECIQFLQENIDPQNNLVITPEDFDIYVKETLVADREYTFNIENELYLPLYTEIEITEPFNSPLVSEGKKAVLKMFAITSASKNTNLALRLYERDVQTGAETQLSGNVGYFNAYKGVVNVKKGVILDSAIMRVDLRKKSFRTTLNNLVTFAANSITV